MLPHCGGFLSFLDLAPSLVYGPANFKTACISIWGCRFRWFQRWTAGHDEGLERFKSVLQGLQIAAKDHQIQESPVLHAITQPQARCAEIKRDPRSEFRRRLSTISHRFGGANHPVRFDWLSSAGAVHRACRQSTARQTIDRTAIKQSKQSEGSSPGPIIHNRSDRWRDRL